VDREHADAVRAYIRILRDAALVFVGAFILIHETLTNQEPNPVLIGAGLVLLGLPPALRADEWIRGGRDSEREE
jgi:hypothetical protein